MTGLTLRQEDSRSSSHDGEPVLHMDRKVGRAAISGELVFEVPESEIDTMRALVREKIENVHPLRVPCSSKSAWGRIGETRSKPS